MHEHVTRAIVLGRRHSGEHDLIADFLTEDLGRIEARAVGGARPHSKFSLHLDPLNGVLVRLVSKNAWTLADIETRTRFPAVRRSPPALSRALEAAFVVRVLVPRMSADRRLFLEFSRMLVVGSVSLPSLLSRLGYDARHARCGGCGNSAVTAFVVSEQTFFCASCGVQFPHNEVVLL